MIYKLHVNERLEYRLRRGFAWIFRKDAAFPAPPQNGDGVAIYGKRNQKIAFGLFDAHGPIAVRILGACAEFGPQYLRDSLANALQLRLNSTQINAQNNAYRVINGESEGLPAIVIDNYAGTWVLKVYAALWLPYLQDLIDIILSDFAPRRLILRFSREVRPYFEAAHFTEAQLCCGSDEEFTEFLENGARFCAQVFKGQKTGFFLDQRTNRGLVREMSKDARVLDLCAFTGGFSVNAALGGAAEVWSIDADKRAIAQIDEHFEMNKEGIQRADFSRAAVCRDVFAFLHKAQKMRKFDLVIADPPSFASSKASVTHARASYVRLFSAAANCLNPKGRILCCSCSSHIGSELFTQIIHQCFLRRARSCKDLSALPFDHPTSFAEARYLKTWLVEV